MRDDDELVGCSCYLNSAHFLQRIFLVHHGAVDIVDKPLSYTGRADDDLDGAGDLSFKV